MIRGHWCIENRLHWPKDVVLDEDASYGREPNALDLFRNNKEVENGVVGNCFHCDEPELLQPANSLDARASTGG
jgi:hypothetical protein